MNGLKGIQTILLYLFLVFALVACSGDDGIDGTGLSGIAAVGEALEDAEVTVKGSNGGRHTTRTDSNGNYSFKDIKDLSTPVYIKVVSNDNKTFYSFRSELTPKTGNTANIHPISDVAARNWFRHNQSREIGDIFDDDDPVDNPPTVSQLEALKETLEGLFEFAFDDFEVEEGFDFIESAFSADGTGFDGLLDKAKITIKDDRITIKVIDPQTGFMARIVINFSIDDDLSDPDTQDPETPTGLLVLPASSSRMIVIWEVSDDADNVGIAGYNVRWGPDTNVNAGMTQDPVPYPVYQDTGLSASQTICYAVQAVDGAGNTSPYSSPVCNTTLPNDVNDPPAAPTGLSATDTTNGSVNLAWTAPGDADVIGYFVYRSSATEPLEHVATSLVTSYEDITVSENVNYCYEVTAVDTALNESPASNSSCAVPTKLPPQDIVPPQTTASPLGGSYSAPIDVTLMCEDGPIGSGCATTYYTDNGDDPTVANATVYSGPITIAANTTLKFFSVDVLGNQETFSTEVYLITGGIDNTPPVTTPSPAGGFFPMSGVSVTVSCDDNGGSGCVSTFCTTDGTDPDLTSPIYNNTPFNFLGTTTLKCFSRDAAGNNEPFFTETYTLDADGPVTTVNPLGGTFPAPGPSVTVSCNDGAGSGCGNTHCTTDGTPPTTGSPVVTAPINISTTTNLRCMSVDLVGNSGAAINEQYTVTSNDPFPVNTTSLEFVNSGDASVEVTNVLANISATDNNALVAYMILDAESGNVPTTPTAATAGWTSITSTANYAAVVGHNFSQVYAAGTSVCLHVWFIDSADQVSNRVEDCITYEDISAPVNTTGNNFIDSGAPNTNDTNVNLQISATDVWGVTGYFVTDNATGITPAAPPANDPGWITVASNTNFSANVPYQFTNTYQTGDAAWVYVWFKDAAGNVSAVVVDDINVELSVFRETFESGPGFWSADNGAWEVGTPSVVGPSACYEGTQCAATVLAGNYPGVDSIYASPSINLPAIDTATEELQLRFWHWFSIQGNDDVRLLIRTSSGPGTWNAWENLRIYNSNSAVWTRTLVNIAAYAGQRVQIGFMLNYGCCGAAPGWYVDDISIDRVSAPVDLSGGASYLENFEGGLSGWSAENGTWEVGEPTAGPGSAYSGTQAAGTVLASTYPGADSYLVSPSIQLPTVNTATEELHLRFWHWFSIQGNDDVRLVIRTETATPGVWNAWELLTTYNSNSSIWTHAMYNIAAYSGQKVQIGFFMNYGCCGAADGWYIDDVTIDLVAAPIDLTSASYFEDFESGTGNWTIHNGSWEVGVPTTGPGSAYSGTQVGATVLDGTYPGTDSYLVSPSLLLPTVNSATEELQLRFWHWFSIQGNDDMRVVVRTETATPGIWNAWELLETYTSNSAVWTRPMINLLDYAGMKVQIGFFQNYGCCGAAAGWYIDDVTIEVVAAPIDLTGGLSYLEDFESGQGGWSVHNGAWEVGTPTTGPGSANSGVQVGATVLNGTYPGNDSYLISPSIILPSIDIVTQELHFRFWHWFSIQGNDDVRAVIRTESTPGIWNAWELLATYTGSSGIWSQPLVNLSAYHGQKIQVGFFLNYGCCGAADGWYVDDVTIYVNNL